MTLSYRIINEMQKHTLMPHGSSLVQCIHMLLFSFCSKFTDEWHIFSVLILWIIGFCKRTCQIDLYKDYLTEIKYISNFYILILFQILSTDKVSTLICSSCVNNVNQWYDYKETCFRSQDKLQKWLETHPQTNPVV